VPHSPHCEISGLSSFQCSNFCSKSERSCCVARHTGKRLFKCQAESCTTELHKVDKKGDRLNCVPTLRVVSQKRLTCMARSSDEQGAEPGLQFVARAMRTPAARKAATGGRRASFMKSDAAGSSTATTPAEAIAVTPAALVCSQWSQDSAPCAAARLAASWLLSWSPCRRRGSPSAAAAARTRAVCKKKELCWASTCNDQHKQGRAE
jgi:hypothetical protein